LKEPCEIPSVVLCPPLFGNAEEGEWLSGAKLRRWRNGEEVERKAGGTMVERGKWFRPCEGMLSAPLSKEKKGRAEDCVEERK
jgi:hypothetical protein